MKQTAEPHKKCAITYAILLFVALFTSLQSLAGQESPETKPQIVESEPSYHPDGSLGQIAVRTRYLYAAASRVETQTVADWQRYSFRADLVALEKLSITLVSNIDKQDSVRYELLGGFKYYFVNPLSDSGSINPDGKIGSPVVSILGGNSFSISPGSRSSLEFDFELIWPISSRLTFSGSYRYFKEIEPFEVSQASLAATYYFSEYHPDSAYVSPDGPVGFPSLRVASGGSENGLFGELAVVFPIKRTLTLSSLLRAERADDPYQRSMAVGFELAIYPQRH